MIGLYWFCCGCCDEMSCCDAVLIVLNCGRVHRLYTRSSSTHPAFRTIHLPPRPIPTASRNGLPILRLVSTAILCPVCGRAGVMPQRIHGEPQCHTRNNPQYKVSDLAQSPDDRPTVETEDERPARSCHGSTIHCGSRDDTTGKDG